MYLLDTNVVSELRRVNRAAVPVLRWSRSVAADDLFLSALTIFELERGALSIGRRDPEQGLRISNWIARRILPSFSGRILPLDWSIARYCSSLHVPNPRPLVDSLIAATAVAHNLTLVTRNARDFEGMVGKQLNPWNWEG